MSKKNFSPVMVAFKSKKMGQFVQQCNKKGIFIEVTVDADAVALASPGVAVIAQDALAAAGNGKLNLISLYIMQYRFKTSFGQVGYKGAEWMLLLRHPVSYSA